MVNKKVDLVEKSNTIAPVSVVIPCFCCAEYIDRAVTSIVNQTQKPAEIILVDDESEDQTPQVLQHILQAYPGLMHHKSLFELHGTFDESFLIAGDYELLLRELRHHDALFVPGIIVAIMQLGGVSGNPSQTLHSLSEVRQAHKKHNTGRSGWRWWVAYFKVRIRMLLWLALGESRARAVLDLARTCLGKPKHLMNCYEDAMILVQERY